VALTVGALEIVVEQGEGTTTQPTGTAAFAMMEISDPEPARAGFCLSPTWQYLA
jgi:hypothetical protein